MSKRYYLSLYTYIIIAIFVILFSLLMIGASGHRYNFTLVDFLVPFCAALTTITLLIYPRIADKYKVTKAAICFLIIGLLTVNLYFIVTHYLTFYSENLVIGFMIFSTIVVACVCAAILTLIIESIKGLGLSKNEEM